ncbi:helix-turn-helix domain-containing protein, partial [Chloroflexota bacterium]
TKYSNNRLPARLLSINEVADFLGAHSENVRQWIKSGLLKSYAIGPSRNQRFKPEDVLNFLHQYRGKNSKDVPIYNALRLERAQEPTRRSASKMQEEGYKVRRENVEHPCFTIAPTNQKRNLGKCPRCNGNMLLDYDMDGWYEQCIQCSYSNEL